MTREEFDAWLVRHGRLFPDLAAWLVERGDARKEILDAWFETLAGIQIKQAEMFTRALLSGDQLPLDRWNQFQLPARVIAMKPRQWTLEELNAHWNPHTGMRGAT